MSRPAGGVGAERANWGRRLDTAGACRDAAAAAAVALCVVVAGNYRIETRPRAEAVVVGPIRENNLVEDAMYRERMPPYAVAAAAVVAALREPSVGCAEMLPRMEHVDGGVHGVVVVDWGWTSPQNLPTKTLHRWVRWTHCTFRSLLTDRVMREEEVAPEHDVDRRCCHPSLPVTASPVENQTTVW